MSFEVLDRAASGRLGKLHTPHGTVTTPTILPVVNPNLPTVPPAELKETFGAQILITNSYILRKHDALRARCLAEGIHSVIGWNGPIMTDSGTFQSYVYGDVDVAPNDIIDFQRDIGVDIGTILDVFTTPDKSHDEAGTELQQTLIRANEAVGRKQGMLLAATVQGGVYPDLRAKAAQALATIDADVAPIGGVVPLMEQGRYADLARVILAAKSNLPSGRPVHLFGAGHPLVFPLAAALGCDLFDSASYAKYAKDDRLIYPNGTRSLASLEELACGCKECLRWKDAAELRKQSNKTREGSIARHNLHVTFAELARVRQAIRDGALWDLVEERAAQHPGLLDAMRVVASGEHADWLESNEPTSGARALVYHSRATMQRPVIRRLHQRLLERWSPRSNRVLLLPERTKPYASSYESYIQSFMREDWTPLVQSPMGLVPLELERMYPIAQSVFPQHVDPDPGVAAFNAATLKRFDGCEIHPFIADEHESSAERLPPDVLDDFDALRIRSTMDMQMGHGAAETLLGKQRPTFRRSPGNDSVRNIFVQGDHVASLRARDSLISLRIAGAERIAAATVAPRHRIQLEQEASSFAAEGKNVMARFVRRADHLLRPGDDAVVVDETDNVVAVARCRLSGWESPSFKRGLAARTTEGARKQAPPIAP